VPYHCLNAIRFNFVPNRLSPVIKEVTIKWLLHAKRYRLAVQRPPKSQPAGYPAWSMAVLSNHLHPLIHALNIDWCDSEMYFVSVAFQPDIDASLCRFFTFHRACLYACAMRSLWHMKGFFLYSASNDSNVKITEKNSRERFGNKRTQNSTNCQSFHNYQPTMLGFFGKSWYKNEFLCTNKALFFCLVCTK